ncbi:unnamed protein product [Kuraishia capsulata CBS 1993]|uniref:Major facilitator superfamily (MFS) profile domain-containing protein n=1 Tax=Kuraishia capsulata CBS 1993 TaxID=1382522 RepID=W6MSN2_9ASCO|nr:uncharacterized protein KUCA_T00000761001 [Kuraishia capsulata CBS 1993]CDK24795.1 unnamed protein product [Kuraishia capsulata CBS 1993]
MVLSGETELPLQKDEKDALELQGLVEAQRHLMIDPEKRPAQFKTFFQELLCLGTLVFAPAAASMSQTAYQISLNKVSEEFNVTGGLLTWAVTSISLANGSVLLFMGGLADGIGRKNAIVISFIAYALFSLIGGFMHNFVALCIMRAIQGMFVAGAVPAGAAVVGTSYMAGKRKNKAMACFAAGAPIGAVLGFVVGGVCCQVLSWRAVQFFYTILFGLLSITAYFSIPNDKVITMKAIKETFKDLDYGGTLLSVAGFVLICFSLTQVDATKKEWKTPYIIALLIVGFFLIVGLGFYEYYVPKNPLMPPRLWKNGNFVCVISIMCFSWMSFNGSITFYAILYFEEVLKYSPLHTTACFLPLPVAGIMVNIFAGLTLHKIPGKFLVIVGQIGFLIAGILWATQSIHRLYWSGPFLSFICLVIGADLTYNVANQVTLSAIPKHMQGKAAGVFNMSIQLAASVALGITSAIVSARNPYYGTSEETKHIPELFDGFKNAYYFAIGCSSISLLLAVFVLKVGTTGNAKDLEREIEENRELEDRDTTREEVIQEESNIGKKEETL